MKFCLLTFIVFINVCLVFSLSHIRKDNRILEKSTNKIDGVPLQDALFKLNKTLSEDKNFKDQAWSKTAFLVDSFGPRMWGSDQLELAINKIREMAINDGFREENIILEPVPNVKVWTRGKESLTLLSPRPFPTNIPMIGLGLSVGGDVKAELAYLESFEDLEKVDVSGKIAFFNAKWKGYSQTAIYRREGVNHASKKGALAVVIRSVTPVSLETPHTGALKYDDGVQKIPACAVSLEDADMFERMIKRGQKVILRLFMEAKFEDEMKTSSNLIIDLPGTSKDEEIIVLGGHLDSWDVGPQTGSTDDLAGFFVCYEAVRALMKLDLKVQRRIRLIGWSGEEMTQPNNGSNVYINNRRNELLNKNNHVMAFETDDGVNRILGFGITGSSKAKSDILSILSYFEDYKMSQFKENGGGADVNRLASEFNVPTMTNIVNETPDFTEYFTTHHTAADTITALNKEGMNRNVAGIAGLIYAVGNLKDKLARNNE